MVGIKLKRTNPENLRSDRAEVFVWRIMIRGFPEFLSTVFRLFGFAAWVICILRHRQRSWAAHTCLMFLTGPCIWAANAGCSFFLFFVYISCGKEKHQKYSQSGDKCCQIHFSASFLIYSWYVRINWLINYTVIIWRLILLSLIFRLQNEAVAQKKWGSLLTCPLNGGLFWCN